MKRTFSLLAALMAFAICFAQTTKTFKFGEIQSLINNGCISINCVYSPAQAGTIEITATELGFEYLKTECSKGALTLSIKKNKIQNICKEYRKAVLYYSDALTMLQINGSGDIVIPSINTKKRVTFQINGSGEIDAKSIEARSFDAYINGSGDIDAHNVKASALTACINGSGDIEIDSADAHAISASLNGSGDIEIKGISSSEIDATIIGSGDIALAGTAKEATFSLNGSGDIDARALKAATITATANASGKIAYNKSANHEITIIGRKSNVIAK